MIHLFSSYFDTPLGKMIAVSDHAGLYLVDFADRATLGRALERIEKRTQLPIVEGNSQINTTIATEIGSYFLGKLTNFTVPLHIHGTSFQKCVWHELLSIAYGTTKSYGQLACSIDNASAYRAVSNANAANHFSIVIPCHRVIGNDGSLRGYGAGIDRKQWLLDHERLYAKIL